MPKAAPHKSFGQRYSELTGWLDANCGADGWVVTPSGMRRVLNDAISIYFVDVALASAEASGTNRTRQVLRPNGYEVSRD